MAKLEIQLIKRPDGGAILRCTRVDGTATWQRHDGSRAAFFPIHDLTHLAVETDLGFRRGFYGLIADGWGIEDTTGKGKRGALPNETATVEHIVGWLDSERASGTTWTADELNEHAAVFAANSGHDAPDEVTDSTLERVRSRMRDLIARWHATPPGETLILTFDSGPGREHQSGET